MARVASSASASSTIAVAPPSSPRTTRPYSAGSSTRADTSATAAPEASRSRASRASSSALCSGTSPIVTRIVAAPLRMPAKPRRTASAVPRCGSCLTATARSPSIASTASAPWPVTTTGDGATPASDSAASTWSSIGRPARGWRTLGMRDRMRVPWPAARTMAAGAVSGDDTLRDGRGARIAASTSSDRCHRLDLDARPLRQLANGERAARREWLRDDALVDDVHARPVADVYEEHRGLDEAVETGARSLEDRGEVGEDALRLSRGVVGHELAGRGVEPELPGDEDEVAGTDGLA